MQNAEKLQLTRAHSQLQSGTPVAGAEHYNGMFDCFSKIVKNEGYVSRSRLPY